MNSPRLQNIPVRTEVGRRVREAFTALGPFISCDYSQIELRVLATLKAEEMDKESAFEKLYGKPYRTVYRRKP